MNSLSQSNVSGSIPQEVVQPALKPHEREGELVNRNILISGAGIAGLTLAYWLKKFGFNPTLVEESSALREGGYIIDFFGAGFNVAEKMGIIGDLATKHIAINELTIVDKNNKRQGGLNALKIRELLNNRAFSLLRSDLAKVLYNSLRGEVEVIFGNSIIAINSNTKKLGVTFVDRSVRYFDLVVGADGLHSQVRTLLFGDESQFEKYYGYYTSSFTIDNYFQNNNLFLSYTVPGKQANIYSLKNGKLAVFFIFRNSQKLTLSHRDIQKQKEILRKEFLPVEWECPYLLGKLDTTSDFYFDSVSQIKMNGWSQHRVTLVGDACDCPSLLSGQGSTLAMTGAYILAQELRSSGGNHSVAFAEYQRKFKPFIDAKQKKAQIFSGSLVPNTRVGLWLRNRFTNLMFIPFFSKWFVRQFMTDDIDLEISQSLNHLNKD